MATWNDLRQKVQTKDDVQQQQRQQRQRAFDQLKLIIHEARKNIDVLYRLEQDLVLCHDLKPGRSRTKKGDWLIMTQIGKIFIMREITDPHPYDQGATHRYQEITDDNGLWNALSELGDRTSDDLVRFHNAEMVRLMEKYPKHFIPYYTQ